MGPSISTANSSSSQSANVFLTQQFSGVCNVTCQNVMSNVVISIIDSNVSGGITLTQTCATDATCLVNSMTDAMIDVQFTAANSTSATNGCGLWPSLLCYNESNSTSRQDIKESISQSSKEECNVSSVNQMNNISIFASGSNIGGGISITQNASTQGQCQLTNSMTASGYATGMATNTARSGKEKKGSKGWSTFAYILGAISLVIVVVIVGKLISSYSASSERTSNVEKAIEARAEFGCPGGAKPALDSSGKVIIDPRTNLPVCPPPGVSSSAKPSRNLVPDTSSNIQRPFLVPRAPPLPPRGTKINITK